MNSVANSTRKARYSQWTRYLQACDEFNWIPLPCDVNQACKYVSYLAETLAYTTILAYYQSVIFKHVCLGLEPVRLSNQVLQTTMRGIKKVLGSSDNTKDPMFPSHLKKLCTCLDKSIHLELVVFLAALLLFRTLQRVSHVVRSDHTLRRDDVKFNKDGCLIRVRSSKTSRGKEGCRFIPVTWARDPSICAVRGLHALFKKYPGEQDADLFSFGDRRGLTYSTFSKYFKTLVNRSGIVGNFASHSLRRGGATYMSMVGCTVPQVKDRGGWASDCVFKYIKPSLSHKALVDKKFASRC